MCRPFGNSLEILFSGGHCSRLIVDVLASPKVSF
jgi:hypothetical protein